MANRIIDVEGRTTALEGRTTAVEGTVQQIDQKVNVVMKELDDLRKTQGTFVNRLESEEERMKMEGEVDDNQAVVAALPAPVSAAEANAREPPVRVVVEERFSSLKMLPEPGQGGFVEQKDSFFNGRKVAVGRDFSCHSRNDIASLVRSFGGEDRKIFIAGVGEYRSLT